MRRRNVLSDPILEATKKRAPDELIIDRAIASARKHGIEITPGRKSAADGNCAFQSVLNNINDRGCFLEKLTFTADYYRRIWMNDMKNRCLSDETWNLGYTKEQIKNGWDEMQETGVYERGLFGDLMLPGISCGIHKIILIFNTHTQSPHDPISVVDPTNFGGFIDSEIPVVLAYNLTHYESIHPKADSDIDSTMALVVSYLGGNYQYSRSDIPMLISSEENSSSLQSQIMDSKNINVGADSFEFQCQSEKFTMTMDGRGYMKCPFCKKHFQRIVPHLKSNKVCSSLIDFDAFKAGFDLFDSDQKKAKEGENESRKRSAHTRSEETMMKEDKHESGVPIKTAEKKRKDCGDTFTDNKKEEALKNPSDSKKKKAEKSRERMARWRASKSAEKKLKDAAKDCERKKKKKENQSADNKNEEAARDKERLGQWRASKSAEKKLKDAATDCERKTKKKANQSADKKKEEDARDKERLVQWRANKSAEKKIIDATKDRLRQSKKHTKTDYKDALRSKDIIAGNLVVDDLKDTVDSMGKMEILCKYCGALKFKKETSSTCCINGKVILEPYPQPPDELLDLWHADTAEARIFRENARSLNNALCLTSIKVKKRNFKGKFNPNIIFEGRVTQFAGPLRADDGEEPCFAQLLVHDPILQNSLRFQNMTIPENMSNSQKKTLERVLGKLQNALLKHNPFVKDFMHVMEIPHENLEHGKIVISAKARPRNEHQRRYNDQTSLQEVSILTNCERHDLVLQVRGGGLQRISDLNPKGMPLHFIVLFPFGTYGWDSEEKHTDGKRRVTPREYYVYHINHRDMNSDYIQMTGRLFQEWICMAWVLVENQKLMFQRMNQKALRADTYKNIREATEAIQLELAPREDGMFQDDGQPASVGRKILSSSFVGSPRWYNGKFQDGMAIVREFHQPDYFITMTCNPNWPEIKSLLKKGQTTQDRPDIVARVFKQKKDQLMYDLKYGHILGKVVAHMNVIEFQKRGLPHAHILIILAEEDRTLTAELVDSVVVAELPPDPNETVDPLKKAELKRLEDIILKNMIHGPCGKENPECPCMENGRCTKNFPKDFQKETVIDRDNNYATYRRRAPEDGGRQVVCPKTNRIIDNRWVVPYNPFLSLRFNCHINIERCTSPKAAKYLYKYVTKGSDRAMVATVLQDQAGNQRDEIAEYEDLRSVGSSEATWHLMAFPIADRYPPVHALRIHLEDQQQVVFDEGTEEEALERQRETELTAFFNLNETVRGCNLQVSSMPKYIDMPKRYRYDKAKKQWISRQPCSIDTVIGRVHTVNPVAGDVFYLRILLHNDHCRGKISFTDLKILENGNVCESYKEVCRELGLLRDDLEWQQVLEESAVTKLSPQIRELFVIILMFCQPANPRALFDQFWNTWVDDFEQQGWKLLITLDLNQLKTMLLLDLELRLQSFEKELIDFGLPKPTLEDLSRVDTITSTDPVLIREEKDYNMPQLEARVRDVAPMFTTEQTLIFDTVLEAVNRKQSLWAFIDARGGCGKTFLLNAILSAVRSSVPGGCVALAMATTGIAANLLELGRTFHSRLKAPLTATEDSTLQISAQSSLAKLVRIAKLLLIDESTMLDRFQLEALDRSLRDLTGIGDQPFGGKIVILAGDFRQCLPVVPGANRAGTVSHCINKSHLWRHFKLLKLTENMRVRASGDPTLEQFDQWTLKIGNGWELNGAVPIPEEMITVIKPNTKSETKNEENAMKKFCEEVFPNIEANISKPGWLEGRTILAPTNKEVDALNDVIQGWLPDIGVKLQSADTLENPEDVFRFNAEYLNTLRPNGFPQHLLQLKPGMPLMLLRNINPRQGLCNGTRLIFDRCIENKLLQCRLVESNRVVLIPRITFLPKPNEYPFEWQRRQFPIRPAFAITINKSQGQTLKFAGVWLRREVFTHGQLYVACSRVSSPKHLRFALMRDPNKLHCTAVNIVYKEVLLSEK